MRGLPYEGQLAKCKEEPACLDYLSRGIKNSFAWAQLMEEGMPIWGMSTLFGHG